MVGAVCVCALAVAPQLRRGWCHVSGCDLVRDADGRWKVLEDNVRTPSGISYVLENRIAMSRLLPELFAGYDVRPVSHYPALLLDALRSGRARRRREPDGGRLDPGRRPTRPTSSTPSWRARWAWSWSRRRTSWCATALCYMRTTRGLARVDSIYRRIDDDFMDPLEFRADSLLGVPGLMGAYRAGNVAIANAVGTGVADDKAVYHYVPEMVRFYLGEEPILDNLPTWLLADPEQLAYVNEHMHELVVKPTGESGGKGVFIGPHADEEALEAQRDRGGRGAGALDRPADGGAVDRAHRAAGRLARPPPRGPAPVRGVRRRHQHRARRRSRGWRCARAR